VLRIFWTSLISILCLGGVAGAHPHVFVDARSGFIFGEDGTLEAVRVSWRYDEFTTLILFDSLDLDQDGDLKLNQADLDAIVEGETNWHADYKGDVYLEVAGKDTPLGRPMEASASFKDNRIEVSFTLPLSEPIAVPEDPVFLRLYDPVFYYAYTILPMETPLYLPAGCETEIIPFEPNAVEAALQEQLAALSRDETPAQEGIGRLFSDEVSLTCG